MEIDRKLIKQLLEKCPDVDWTPNANGEITDPKLNRYITSQTKQLRKSVDDAYTKMHAEKFAYEATYASENPASLCPFFLSLSTAIYNAILEDHWEATPLNHAYNSLISNLFEQFRAIFVLVLSGMTMQSMAQVRTLYESYLQLYFIQMYPESASPFLDHQIVKQYQLQKKTGLLDKTDPLNAQYQAIMQKYGKSFSSDYGWTFSVIPEAKERKLWKLSELVGFDGYESLYRMTSELLHANAFSIQLLDMHQKFAPVIVTNSIEILTNAVIKLMSAFKLEAKNRIPLMDILYRLREDLLGEPRGGYKFDPE
jgi:AraC-like DNA-binding protein